MPITIADSCSATKPEDIPLAREVTTGSDRLHAGAQSVAEQGQGKLITRRPWDSILSHDGAPERQQARVDYAPCSILPPSSRSDLKVLRGLGVNGIDVSRPEGRIIGELYGDASGVAWTRQMYDERAAKTPENVRSAAVARYATIRDTSTPNAMVALAKLHRHRVGLTAGSEQMLLRAMRDTDRGSIARRPAHGRDSPTQDRHDARHVERRRHHHFTGREASHRDLRVHEGSTKDDDAAREARCRGDRARGVRRIQLEPFARNDRC